MSQRWNRKREEENTQRAQPRFLKRPDPQKPPNPPNKNRYSRYTSHPVQNKPVPEKPVPQKPKFNTVYTDLIRKSLEQPSTKEADTTVSASDDGNRITFSRHNKPDRKFEDAREPSHISSGRCKVYFTTESFSDFRKWRVYYNDHLEAMFSIFLNKMEPYMDEFTSPIEYSTQFSKFCRMVWGCSTKFQTVI